MIFDGSYNCTAAGRAGVDVLHVEADRSLDLAHPLVVRSESALSGKRACRWEVPIRLRWELRLDGR